ncbi:MAG: hypothetical protein P4L27_11660 [Ignavibacteriaceae bacterium]|nr:hypothetical protein [Ignavibacteriaceae bacterium]
MENLSEDNRSIFKKWGFGSAFQGILWVLGASLFFGSYFPDSNVNFSVIFPRKLTDLYFVLKIISPFFILALAYWSTPKKLKILTLVIGIILFSSFELYYFYILNEHNKYSEKTDNHVDTIKIKPSDTVKKLPVPGPKPIGGQTQIQPPVNNEGVQIFTDKVNKIEWGVWDNEYLETWDNCFNMVTKRNIDFHSNWRFPRFEELKLLQHVVPDKLIKNFGYWTTAEKNSDMAVSYNPKTNQVESIYKTSSRYLIMVRVYE